VLAGWEDLPAREDEAGVQAGDPIFLSPDHRVDPLLSLYAQSARFRRYTAETRRNYATDIALLLTFLWGRGNAWTDAVQRDLEDYEHWRRFARENPDRVGGTKWNRELAAFTSLYGWAVQNRHVARNPVEMRQVRRRDGDVLTVAAARARAKDARPSNVHWLTPRTWRRWTDVGLRGHGRDGVPEPGWAGRLEDRNVAFVRLLVTSGLRRSEGGSSATARSSSTTAPRTSRSQSPTGSAPALPSSATRPTGTTAPGSPRTGARDDHRTGRARPDPRRDGPRPGRRS